jgi:hypothetical protein
MLVAMLMGRLIEEGQALCERLSLPLQIPLNTKKLKNLTNKDNSIQYKTTNKDNRWEMLMENNLVCRNIRVLFEVEQFN